MNALYSICPHRYGTHIVKKIRTKDGREEYYCPYCQTGGLVKPENRFSEAQKLQILEHSERCNTRAMKETFGVSPTTLTRCEKAKSKKKRASLKKKKAAFTCRRSRRPRAFYLIRFRPRDHRVDALGETRRIPYQQDKGAADAPLLYLV